MDFRRATLADVAAITALTRAAYAHLVPLIGRVPGVQEQVEIDDGDRVTLGQHDLHAVRQGRFLDVREDHGGRGPALGHLLAVGAG